MSNSISSSTVPVLAVTVPLSDASTSITAPNVKVAYSTPFIQSAPSESEAVRTALKTGVVNIDIQNDLSDDAGWEMLEEFLNSALKDVDPEATKPAVVLCKFKSCSSLFF